jgi:hypothetical protein
MALGGYPRSAAKRLLGGRDGEKATRDIDRLFSRVRPYIRSVADFDFDARITASENLRYLAGVIRVAKLRAALLSEYNT